MDANVTIKTTTSELDSMRDALIFAIEIARQRHDDQTISSAERHEWRKEHVRWQDLLNGLGAPTKRNVT